LTSLFRTLGISFLATLLRSMLLLSFLALVLLPSLVLDALFLAFALTATQPSLALPASFFDGASMSFLVFFRLGGLGLFCSVSEAGLARLSLANSFF